MAHYRADKTTKLRPNDLCRLGDVITCGHSGCHAVVLTLVAHPDVPGAMTHAHSSLYAPDADYRTRCRFHATPPANGYTDPDAYRIDAADQADVPGQLSLF